MRKFLKNNGLTIALLALFAASLAGQYVSGWYDYNENRSGHRQAAVGFVEYAGSGHFLEALFENWESEFLQMSAYVLLTVFLFQKGSSESKRPDTVERVDMILPESKNDPEMPWPVRKGGLALKLYSHSLSIALLLLFAASFVFHAIGGTADYNEEQTVHGQPAISVTEFMSTSRFWFESFQNWQSEFLSVGVMILLTVYLREKGSPESKPVDSPHTSGPE